MSISAILAILAILPPPPPAFIPLHPKPSALTYLTQEEGSSDDGAAGNVGTQLPPWKANPERLVSLYEIAKWLNMEPFKAHTFYNTGKLLESLASAHGTSWVLGTSFSTKLMPSPELDKSIDPNSVGQLQLILNAMRTECDAIKLKRSTQYVDHIIAKLSGNSLAQTYRDIGFLLRELDKHIRWDMEEELFMYIPSDRSEFYKNEKLIQRESSDNFPSAAEEIKAAGTCYAAGLYTAAVSHSMRALEKPIHSVADKIGGINLPRGIDVATWGDIYREIDNKVIKLRQSPLTVARDEELSFYSQLNKEFGYFNDAWRRFVAHSRMSYDQDQSLSALKHVISFIDIAAGKGLKELVIP